MVPGLRDRILNHGLAIASAQGWNALSMGDLARDLELPRRGLSDHFESKEQLQLGVLEQAAQLFVREVIEPGLREPQGELRLKALFWRWLAWSRSPRLKGGCPFVHASSELEALPRPIAAKLKEFLDHWSGILRQAAEEANGLRFRPDSDSDQLVFELYGLYLSHHFWHWSMRDGAAEWRTVKAFERLIASAQA